VAYLARLPGHQHFAGNALLMSADIVSVQVGRAQLMTELSAVLPEALRIVSGESVSLTQFRMDISSRLGEGTLFELAHPRWGRPLGGGWGTDPITRQPHQSFSTLQ
jgi:hypothetical protein